MAQPTTPVERINQHPLSRGGPSNNSVWTVGPEGSTEHLVRVARLSFFRKASRKRLELLLGIAVLVSLILLTALCISVYLLAAPASTTSELCLTPQCLRSASTFMESMDQTVNPCDNFYEFTCGKWNKEHFIRGTYKMNDWFLERSWLFGRDITDFLKQNDSESEPLPVHQARTIYRSCQDFDSMNKIGLSTLWQLLGQIGLPQSPPLDNPPKQSLMVSLAKAKKYVGLDYLIGIGIMSLPTNKTVNKIAISFAYDLMLPSRTGHENHIDIILNKMIENGDEEIIKIWKRHAAKILEYHVNINNISSIDEEMLNLSSEQIITFQKNISDIEKNENVTGPLFSEIPEEMTVYELQKLVDSVTESGKSKINWIEFLTTLYANIPGINLDLGGKDTILVYKKEYFKLLSCYLESVEAQLIELTIWWQITYGLSSHINEELADLKQTLALKAFSDGFDSRASLCMETVYRFMTIAISYPITREESMKKKKEKVNEMLALIQDIFSSLVKKLNWMDKKTKQLTLEKVKTVRKFIGYPEWMNSKESMQKYYANITIDENTHLANLLSILQAETLDQLKDLRIPHNSSYADFDPLDINAYYIPNDNSITVPAGILQFPFYDMGLEALNYGAIGVILGHELTHGFDNNGRKYDKDGNLNNWWSNSSIEEYTTRTKCYVDEYSNFYLPSINKTVNGNLTLGENLADNGGLKEAFLAYKSYRERHGEELRLPGLHNYTHEQLFFLGYGNIWCSAYTDDYLNEALEDEHSPHFVRVIVALQNLEEFARAWNCPVDSTMNPSRKCKLWT